MMDLSVVPYDHAKIGSPLAGDGELRYRECMRNHAASLGGQAFDGCGEFMPSSPPDPLKCAACGCHRNFHRRDDPGGDLAFAGRPLLLAPPPPAYFPSPFSRMPPPPPPLPAARMGSETPPRMDGGGGGEGSSATRKRNRTKFTAEQKERMQAFAERIGWRIQRQDDMALEEFCGEIGVKRHVLKVWMHNNKSHLSSATAKREEVAAVAGAAPASVEGISV